jgi:hypothetical protein
MQHLTDAQLTDAIEERGGLDQDGAAHLGSCEACAGKVAALRAVLRNTEAVTVPEPSPLFWEHFGARVSGAIDSASAPERSGWAWRSHRHWLAAAALVVVTALGFYAVQSEAPAVYPDTTPVIAPPGPAIPGSSETGGAESTGASVDPVEDDSAWAVMRSLAVDLHYDDARDAGVLPQPGSIETAATELSTIERAELVRLLQDELKRNRSSSE